MTEYANNERVLWSTDDPDVRAVSVAFIAGVSRVAPALVEPATHLLGRLARPNWTMEWYLPRWVGAALGTSPAARRSLMLSNVYGLAYVRLQDDLADHETGDLPGEVLSPLSTALYALWTGEYIELFGGAPAFWDRFRLYLSQWITATLEDNPGAVAHPAPLSPEGRLQLAHRGAPLKICVAGAALLADCPELIAEMETAIDHLLVAAVLLDHAGDWVDDVEEGRYNAFVAYASSAPQITANRELNRQRVREEIYLGATAQPYYAAIREEIHAANRMAHAIGCEELGVFLAWLDAETIAIGEQLATGALAQLQSAAAQLFGAETHAPIRN